jgi:hypothetical protein
MSTPAILAVGTREQWRGVEVTSDGTPAYLGVLLLRLLRRSGGLKAVAQRFVSAPWGWRSLPRREPRDSGWAPWLTPENPDSQTHFIHWYVLDLEGGTLEVYDVSRKAWLEPARIAGDGRALNRPDWVPTPSGWLPTRPAVAETDAHRVLGCLRVADIPLEQARTVVLAWMKGLVRGAEQGEWQLGCGRGVTCWSAWQLAGQRLWIPDRVDDGSFAFILATEDCGVGYASDSPEAWLAAAQGTGLSRKKAARLVGDLFAAAVQPWARHPVRAGIVGALHSEPSGALDALKRKLFPPEPMLLRAPGFLEVLPAVPHELLLRQLERDDGPMSLVQDDDGFHPAKDFTPPKGWLLDLVRAMSVPVPPSGLPERRRVSFWPYDEA